MSRAEELLNSLSEVDAGTYTTDIDNERHIIINEDRTITVPTELRNIAVQYDHNVETVTFDCPRYWDEHDFSKMHVYINYRRPDGESFTYPAENLIVPKRDDNIIQFTWRISRNVTLVKGAISFLVCIKTVNDEGEEEPHWNSRICSDLTVLEGMECSSHDVVDMYPDVIEAILTRVENLEGSSGLTDEQIAKAIADYLEEHPIEGGGGTPGADGKDGEDGFSPKVSVEEIEGGSRVTITDIDGDKSFDVLNGKDGKDGEVDYEQVAGMVDEYLTTNPPVAKVTINGVEPDENGNFNIDDIVEGTSNSVDF